MNTEVMPPMSAPAPKRDRRPEGLDEMERGMFLLAVSRAFLTAVKAHDERSAIPFSRAFLSIMHHEPQAVSG